MTEYFVWLDTSGPEITVAGIHERIDGVFQNGWAISIPSADKHWALNRFVHAEDELEAYKLAQKALRNGNTSVWFCEAGRVHKSIRLWMFRRDRRIYAQETQPIRGEPDAEAVPQTDNSG